MVFINFKLNFTNVIAGGPMTVALHHPKAYLGNNAMFYPGPVTMERIYADSILDLVIHTKVTKRAEEEKTGEDVSEDDFYDCINTATRAMLNASLDQG